MRGVFEHVLPARPGAVSHLLSALSSPPRPGNGKDSDTKEIVAYDFFGGNLRGVAEKLDYLQNLGISCIYFNPVSQ